MYFCNWRRIATQSASPTEPLPISAFMIGLSLPSSPLWS